MLGCRRFCQHPECKKVRYDTGKDVEECPSHHAYCRNCGGQHAPISHDCPFYKHRQDPAWISKHKPTKTTDQLAADAGNFDGLRDAEKAAKRIQRAQDIAAAKAAEITAKAGTDLQGNVRMEDAANDTRRSSSPPAPRRNKGKDREVRPARASSEELWAETGGISDDEL